MMKKIVSILLALVMLLGMTSVWAEELPAVSGDTPNASGGEVTVRPYLDMEVKWASDDEYENGPINKRAYDAKADFKTTLDMEKVFETFIEWYGYGLGIIERLRTMGATEEADSLNALLRSIEIEGQFVVEITYPEKLTAPKAFLEGSDMFGFKQGDKEAEEISCFKEVGERTYDEDTNTLTITIEAVSADHENALTGGELWDNKEAYLEDLSLEATGVKVTKPGTYTVVGKMSGYTKTEERLNGAINSLLVDYIGRQDVRDDEGNLNYGKVNPIEIEEGVTPDPFEYPISATVVLTKPSGGGGGGVADNEDKLEFKVDGQEGAVDSIFDINEIHSGELPYPTKPGYKFSGWYYDPACTMLAEGDISIVGTRVLYGYFSSIMLDSDDHFAYVIGYPEGDVRPTNNITREEVATIFYRLLREDKLIEIATDKNDFTDVERERWSNKAISTLANGGYIKGYEDGTFGPSKPITRAEFAAMATRYAALVANKDHLFIDTDGHWAEDYINKAATATWVTGYEDGTFAPDKNITRAEVMTIINRMLGRAVDEKGLHADTKFWYDMDGTEWYYYNVLEATNAHNFTRRADGKAENWTEITPNKIWIELDEMENADK